jgi:hypothetical protein
VVTHGRTPMSPCRVMDLAQVSECPRLTGVLTVAAHRASVPPCMAAAVRLALRWGPPWAMGRDGQPSLLSCLELRPARSPPCASVQVLVIHDESTASSGSLPPVPASTCCHTASVTPLPPE